jgi:hypothetical protein
MYLAHKPYVVMWVDDRGWHTIRFANREQAERCAVRHGVSVSVASRSAP